MAEEPVLAAVDVEVVVVPDDICIHPLSLELYRSPFSVDNYAWVAGNSLTNPHMEGFAGNQKFSGLPYVELCVSILPYLFLKCSYFLKHIVEVDVERMACW